MIKNSLWLIICWSAAIVSALEEFINLKQWSVLSHNLRAFIYFSWQQLVYWSGNTVIDAKHLKCEIECYLWGNDRAYSPTLKTQHHLLKQNKVIQHASALVHLQMMIIIHNFDYQLTD